MDEAIIVPFIIFATIGVIVWLVLHFGNRKRVEAHQTLRLALEKGQAISPELLEELTRMGAPPQADLRRGVLFLSVAIAFAILAVIVGTEERDAVRPLLGVAVFPFSVALAYLGLHFFAGTSRR